MPKYPQSRIPKLNSAKPREKCSSLPMNGLNGLAAAAAQTSWSDWSICSYSDSMLWCAGRMLLTLIASIFQFVVLSLMFLRSFDMADVALSIELSIPGLVAGPKAYPLPSPDCPSRPGWQSTTSTTTTEDDYNTTSLCNTTRRTHIDDIEHRNYGAVSDKHRE